MGDLLGFTPGCDFMCDPIGNGFGPGEVAIEASRIGKIALTAADWLGIALGILILQRGGPPAPPSSSFAQKLGARIPDLGNSSAADRLSSCSHPFACDNI